MDEIETRDVAVVDEQTGVVLNVVRVHADPLFGGWEPPDGAYCADIRDGAVAFVGGSYFDGVFSEPPDVDADPVAARIVELREMIVEGCATPADRDEALVLLLSR